MYKKEIYSMQHIQRRRSKLHNTRMLYIHQLRKKYLSEIEIIEQTLTIKNEEEYSNTWKKSK